MPPLCFTTEGSSASTASAILRSGPRCTAPGPQPGLHRRPLSFGIMICNDFNDPELAADMAARGARVIFVPSNNSLPAGKGRCGGFEPGRHIARAQDNA